MKILIYLFLITKISNNSTANSHLHCQPTITRLSAEHIQSELKKSEDSNNESSVNTTTESSKANQERMLALRQTKRLVLDKDGSQTLNYLPERRLNDSTGENNIEGQYEIELKCVAEGPNFKIVTELSMRCGMHISEFVVKYSARKKNEGEYKIRFIDRLESENILEAEKISHTFTSKDIVNLSVNEETCEFMANNTIIHRIMLGSILLKLILI